MTRRLRAEGTGIAVLVAAAVGAGLVFGWDSLAALGLTTVIVSLLPCLAMCPLGVCASRMDRKDAATAAGTLPPREAQSAATASAPSIQASSVDSVRRPAPDAPAS